MKIFGGCEPIIFLGGPVITNVLIVTFSAGSNRAQVNYIIFCGEMVTSNGVINIFRGGQLTK